MMRRQSRRVWFRVSAWRMTTFLGGSEVVSEMVPLLPVRPKDQVMVGRVSLAKMSRAKAEMPWTTSGMPVAKLCSALCTISR